MSMSICQYSIAQSRDALRVKLLSVQCYVMHSHNINLPLCVCVCLCVCVSVTLSANTPTGQTPQRIFTVDSLKDADLR